MKTYLILFLAIVFETVATSFLKQSEQFTRLVPSVLTVLGYAAAFYCLSVVLKNIPVGIAYAIWSGVGIILITLIGFFVFKQHLDLAAIIGLALIIAGVVVINVFSNSVSHRQGLFVPILVQNAATGKHLMSGSGIPPEIVIREITCRSSSASGNTSGM